MNVLPVLGAPLHWHPALLALTAIAVSPGAHLLASPLLEGRKVTWRDNYAAVLVGDPLLALAAGLGASMAQPGGPRGWPASWVAGCVWLAGGWTFGLWQSRHEFLAGRYTRGQILSPTKLWHQFIVYPLLGYWVTATEWSAYGTIRTAPTHLPDPPGRAGHSLHGNVGCPGRGRYKAAKIGTWDLRQHTTAHDRPPTNPCAQT